jgi:hypothetical protein
MMQQGGVSKATKTVNLSEDIFAGPLDLLNDATRCFVRFCKHQGNGQFLEDFHMIHGCSLGANPSDTCNTFPIISQHPLQTAWPGMDFTLRGNGRSIKPLGLGFQ